MYNRFLSEQIINAISFSPATYLSGPRQAGKSTLVSNLSEPNKREYISFDNVNNLRSAKTTSRDFIELLQNPCTLDEIQRVPELMLPIKEKIDQNRIPGFFLLTGSANILTLPQVADSLVGRIVNLNLLPFSVQEINKFYNPWLNHVFIEKISDLFTPQNNFNHSDLIQFILSGGYPPIWQGLNNSQKQMWFRAYIQTILERDLREISNFQNVLRMHTLFQHLCLRSAHVLNTLDLARDCQIPMSSLSLYLKAIESIFLISRVPGWYTNKHKRLIKGSKNFLNDSGILCHALNIDQISDTTKLSSNFGLVVETFVYNELCKQKSWLNYNINIYHYRTYQGTEVDFVLENNRQEVVGIEVKTSKTISQSDIKGLLSLQEDSGENFKTGIILYMGTKLLPLEKQIYAVPLSFIL